MTSFSDSGGVADQAGFSRRAMLLGLAGAGCLAGLTAMGMGGGMAGRQIKPPAGAIPRSYFGLHMHRADAGTPWPPVGFGSWRLWDAYTTWPMLEPQRGAWDFTRLDKYVAMAALTGVDILLPFGLSPAWASARPDEPSAYKPGNAAEPKRLDDWRNYVRTVAERYKGRIRYYELWNEPNLRNFYTGSVESMLELARETYAILKQVDSRNLLAAPAVTEGGKQLEWLDRYLALGGGQFMDILSHHFYVPRAAPEQMLPMVADVRKIMARHGVAYKPLWNTESGWWMENGDGTDSRPAPFTTWKQLGLADAAAYVSRALILGWAVGMERFYWFAWDNHSMGLIEPTTKALKPAGHAFARTRVWLQGAVMTGCEMSDDVWVCTLNPPDGGKARIVWLENGAPRPWRPPVDWAVGEVTTLDGLRSKLEGAPAALQLSQTPLYLR